MRTRVIILLLGFTLVVLAVWVFARDEGTSDGQKPSTNSICIDERYLRNAINMLARDDGEETREAAERLVFLAKKSDGCRDAVIRQLVQAMNKPNLNLEADRSSFFLWSNGSLILGELKATEALDLLIDHLDLKSGIFSGSMYHQPAIGGIESMGPIAIPKLRFALKNHQNRDVRLAAAWCLFDIGGSDAMDSLQEALKTESDQCVRRLIELYFQPATAEVIQQRLKAFRCGN